MTQFQFELIAKIVEIGAPVFYEELVGSIDKLIKERNALANIVSDNFKQDKEAKENSNNQTDDEEAIS